MDYDYSVDSNILNDGAQISGLLHLVYVGGGYTDADLAKKLFEPASVFERGLIFTVRESNQNEIVGVLILVTSESGACRMAKEDEAELQLLAVKPEFRGFGLARCLIELAIRKAKEMNKSRLLLWTQESMVNARALYEKIGFVPVRDFEQNGRLFTVYQFSLSS